MCNSLIRYIIKWFYSKINIIHVFLHASLSVLVFSYLVLVTSSSCSCKLHVKAIGIPTIIQINLNKIVCSYYLENNVLLLIHTLLTVISKFSIYIHRYIYLCVMNLNIFVKNIPHSTQTSYGHTRDVVDGFCGDSKNWLKI